MRRLTLLLVGLLALAGVAVASSGGATQAQPRWVIRDLGTLGGESSEAVAINDAGQVVGWADTKEGVWQAFLWQQGKTVDLGVLPGRRYSEAVAINERGQIIGTSYTDGKDRHAFLWENGRMRDLGTLGGSASSASDINELGQIVGWSLTKSGKKHACLWQKGKIRDLGTLNGANSAAVEANDKGQIVGWSETAATSKKGWPREAVMWQAGGVRDLGTMHSGDWGPGPHVIFINEPGQVVWNRGSEYGGCVLWQHGRKIGLGGTDYAAINDQGWVVGGYSLWRNGRTTDLDFQAHAISNRGLIVGFHFGGSTGPYVRASAWTNGTTVELPTRNQERRVTKALAVNERDVIVGRSNGHAALWTLKP